jgi:hypothetical protein
MVRKPFWGLLLAMAVIAIGSLFFASPVEAKVRPCEIGQVAHFTDGQEGQMISEVSWVENGQVVTLTWADTAKTAVKVKKVRLPKANNTAAPKKIQAKTQPKEQPVKSVPPAKKSTVAPTPTHQNVQAPKVEQGVSAPSVARTGETTAPLAQEAKVPVPGAANADANWFSRTWENFKWGVRLFLSSLWLAEQPAINAETPPPATAQAVPPAKPLKKRVIKKHAPPKSKPCLPKTVQVVPQAPKQQFASPPKPPVSGDIIGKRHATAVVGPQKQASYNRIEHPRAIPERVVHQGYVPWPEPSPEGGGWQEVGDELIRPNPHDGAPDERVKKPLQSKVIWAQSEDGTVFASSVYDKLGSCPVGFKQLPMIKR